MRFAFLSLFATLLFAGTDAPIGEERSTGDVSILSVASLDEYTVFLKTRSCDTNAVAVHVVFADKKPGERFAVTKTARFRDCAGGTVRLTFPTEGRPVSEVRIEELSNRAAYSIKP
jgi:hypothetical protein